MSISRFISKAHSVITREARKAAPQVAKFIAGVIISAIFAKAKRPMRG